MAPSSQNGISAHAHHVAAVQAVARQEALGCQHAEGDRGVVSFRMSPPGIFPLQPRDQAATPLEQGFILPIQRSLLFPQCVQPLDLFHGPA